LLAGAVVVSLPYLWLVTTAVKPRDQIFAWPPIWIPRVVMWRNFVEAWNYAPFTVYLRNTLLITVCNTLGTVLSASLVGFGFARLRFPGRDVLFLLVLSTMMLPGVVTLIPVFVVYSKLHWVNTYLPLIVPAYFGGGAFNIFLLRQFFRGIPHALEDAARIDGANTFTIWWRIFLPLSGPAVTTVAVFAFMNNWNDFLNPLIYLNQESKFTLALGLQRFLNEHGAEWDLLMAASVLITLPMIAIFFSAQQYFMQGIRVTGVKG
jgi:multiple sugar transport system permease protein